jgi:hypothetical protein
MEAVALSKPVWLAAACYTAVIGRLDGRKLAVPDSSAPLITNYGT